MDKKRSCFGLIPDFGGLKPLEIQQCLSEKQSAFCGTILAGKAAVFQQTTALYGTIPAGRTAMSF